MHVLRHGRSLSRWLLGCCLIITLCSTSARAEGQIFEVEYPPATEAGQLIYGVTYTVWIPDGVTRLRGVIVHQHGCGSGACKGGATAAYDLHWQALAKKWDCALLGPYYHQEDKQDCRMWCDPRKGSNAAFLQGLKDLSAKSGHPELEQVPWCLWGHSGGGFWASLMQTMHPERIVAIWFRSGTAYEYWEKGEVDKPTIPLAAYGIPIMLNPGIKERDDQRFRSAWTGAELMFNAYRQAGAPAAFTPDPRSGHECADSRYMAIPFFDACLALRLPDAGAESQTLKPVDQPSGWLAAGDNPPVAYANFQGDAAKASWLPDAATAQAWTEYLKVGAISDTTAPPAPTAVRVALNGDEQPELTWDATADFESGIQAFVILRDGQPLAQVPEKPIGRFGRPLFQTMSYHDTPEAPLPQLHFIDKTAPKGARPRYEVITVNSVGLKSPPAAGQLP